MKSSDKVEASTPLRNGVTARRGQELAERG